MVSFTIASLKDFAVNIEKLDGRREGIRYDDQEELVCCFDRIADFDDVAP
jgi:hypothetical protein